MRYNRVIGKEMIHGVSRKSRHAAGCEGDDAGAGGRSDRYIKAVLC